MSIFPESLGRYRLVSLLGEGGMGKVYKAYDAALERHVAIKILPAQLVSDAARVSRFVQEARAASALNHPNVIVVHDIGEERPRGQIDAIHYIAMELIDGTTLREQLDRGALELRKALRIVLQVAEGLAAAHTAGIVHRDLKPENIMVSASGFAKVFDFGLAKLHMRQDDTAATETTQIKDTDPGTLLGTASYMAPEQALGKVVDHRADIFSLGSILYELTTGHRAFSGQSVVDTLHRIIHGDPDPIDGPRELIRIIRRALAKEPDDRYQTVKDFAIDLRELLREVESDSKVSTITTRKPSPRRPWIAIAMIAAVAVLVISWLAFVKARRPAPAPLSATTSMRVARVTASGKVIASTISYDGTFVAYVVAEQDEQSLWLRQMASGQSLQLLPPAHIGYWGLSFGPDGLIYYVEKSPTAPVGTMYQISPLGGAPRRIASGVDSPPTFSPDGKRMAFVREYWPTTAKSALFVASADGSTPRPLVVANAPDSFAPIFFAGAAWSPDGKSIATTVRNAKEGKARIVAVDVAAATVRTIADPGWRAAGQVAWLPDGSGLVAIASVDPEDRSQVWFVSYPDGEIARVTNDLFDYRSVSLTADGKSLLTVAADRTADIWVHADGAAPMRLTSGKLEGSHGISTLSDGRIVFTSLESGKPDIWIMNRDGSDRTLLTRDVHRNRAPVVTPDGRYLVYLAHTGRHVELCRLNIDGTNRVVLSVAALGVPPTVSPDGKTVVFEGIDAESPERRGSLVLTRVGIDGGPRVHLTDFAAQGPAFSPDGSQIAFYFRSVDPNGHNVGVIAASGGKPVKTLPGAPPFAFSQLAWTPDGQALVVNTMPSDRANLWRLPLDGTKPARMTNFEEKMLLSFAPLRGRGGWVMARGELARDAVLITGFQ